MSDMVLKEKEMNLVLKNSLYPGASDASIEMVKAYCIAAKLDIMMKPVHIVPMWDKSIGAMRDVVMPGVGTYRIQADRSKKYAGISEPEFGPMITSKFSGKEFTYPEWCKVTVSKILDNGTIGLFPAKEYWIENYAMKGGKDKDQYPNAMWEKRKHGQLAKCAEGQALRKAFPELGSQPTAEEMIGKPLGYESNIIQEDSDESITAEQAEEITKLLIETKSDTDVFCKKAMKVDSVQDIPKSRYAIAVEKILDKKRMQEKAAKPKQKDKDQESVDAAAEKTKEFFKQYDNMDTSDLANDNP